MQKVIQRTATARKQAQKKLYRAKKEEKLLERKDNIRTRKEYGKVLIDTAKAARQARWEDWAKGPLAPMRDSGLQATTFGALDQAVVHPPKIPKHQRRRHILFAPGDRVCIIKGRDKGRIGDIEQVNEETETVLIKNLNVADISVPKWAKESMNVTVDIMPQNLPVPIDNIRHVIAMYNPDTGATKDTIVEHVHAGPPFIERPQWSKLPKFTRYVTGNELEIPWPTEEAPELEDGELDTLRLQVDEVTWVPSLREPPFPSTVLDELRNKYSRFRTRHDPEYVRAKIIEEYRQQYLESQSLLTPFGELRRIMATKSAEEKKSKLDADGNVVMDRATAGFIHRFMKTSREANAKPAEQAA